MIYERGAQQQNPTRLDATAMTMQAVLMRVYAARAAFLGAISALLTLCSLPIGAQDLSGYTGAQLYGRFCAACHGPHGHGDGPVVSDLNVAVPDITRIAKRRSGSFPADVVRSVIDGRDIYPAHGTRSMPVWGYQFRVANPSAGQENEQADQLIDRLVAYLESIQEPMQRGEHLAQLLCGACHVVAKDQEFPPYLKQPAPSFLDIAARPGTNAESLQRFLATTHWDQRTIPMSMPNPLLTPEETDALTRYILSLRQP